MSKTTFYSLDGPLDSMPADGQMRSANLSSFAYLVNNCGGDSRAILERFHIDPWLARDPDHYIDCKALVDMLEYCSQLFNDPFFGIRLAKLQEPDVFGCVTALCRAAANVQAALDSFISFMPVVHSPNLEMQMRSRDGITELFWAVPDSLGANYQANYQAVMLNLKLLRQICGPAFRPVTVRLRTHLPARDLPELEKHLGCSVVKTSDESALCFASEVLKQPVPSANRLLFQLLGGYLEKVRNAARKSTVERVEDYVRGALASRHCSIERCAEKLGMSVRTLQSNLSEDGMKFSDILESHRSELAKSYLKQPQLSLDDVAANLGYSEQSSFGRAFKRWTGVTPKQFRRQGVSD